MRRSAWLGFFCSCALSLTAPAAAQDKDAWALSGGFDLFELRAGKGDDVFFWDAAFSFGTSADQLMLVTSGGGVLGNQIDEVEARLFYGRTVGNTTLLIGARRDIKPDPRYTYAVVGAAGTIGTRLNWESYAFLSDRGDLTGEAQIIYQLPLTDRLYLEPRATIGWAAKGVTAQATRSGLTEGEATLRLRYRLTDNINIYTAAVHGRLLGGTRRLGRQQGEAVQSTQAVIGFGYNL